MAFNTSEHGPFYCEKMVTCPLDPTHIIRMSKIQFHITRCLKNYPDLQYTRCPFNSTHLVIAPKTVDAHLEECPDKSSMLSFKYRTNTGLRDRVAPVSNRIVEAEEDWSDCNFPTYDPSKQLRRVEVPPVLKIASKKEKRKYKNMLQRNRDKATDPYYPGMLLTDSEDEEGAPSFSDFFSIERGGHKAARTSNAGTSRISDMSYQKM